MGVAVAISLANSGSEVLWASEGRGPDTARRARDAGLTDAGTLAGLATRSTAIVSVCPPEFAESVASEVQALGFRGLYVDANAVAPERKKRMERTLTPAGIDLVDGGIIGFPPVQRGTSWLCLSGARAEEAAGLFAAGPMETDIVGDRVGQASGLKMCFASWTKGSTALHCALLAAAERMGVLEDLKRYWERRGPDIKWVEHEMLRAAPKAWRFAPEMKEIAATFEAEGLPGGFHQAAAEVYQRLAEFKNDDEVQVADVIGKLAGTAAKV